MISMCPSDGGKAIPATRYKYGMRLRGFAHGCQPLRGFVERLDDETGKYYDILVYYRKLTEKEQHNYDLDRIE